MRLTFAFISLATVLSFAAMQRAREATGAIWLIVATEGYAALCLWTLALLYGLKQVGFPVDRLFLRTGSATILRALLLPYLVLGVVVLFLARWIDREDLFNPIGPGLYLGRLPFPDERAQLKAAGVEAVLNLCWEFPRLSGIHVEECVKSAHVPILDGVSPTSSQFRDAVATIAAWRAEGKTVLIHCAQGHGRSATIAAAALCELGLVPDVPSALSLIQAARPRARPSTSQKAALLEFVTLRDFN